MIWLNGQLKSDDALVVGATDRGVLLGDGLFETLKIDNGHVYFLTEHLCRLQVSADELGIRLDRAALRQGLKDLLSTVDPSTIGSARMTVTRGPGPRGLSPIKAMAQHPVSFITLGPKLGHQAQVEPDRLILAPFCRSSGALSSRMKTLSYTDHLHAKAMAEDAGAADALFLNEEGYVSCTTMANIFVKAGEVYLTPPLSAGILPGIIRARLLHLASRMGIKIQVRRLRTDDLLERPVFRTNSLFGVRPAWFDPQRKQEQAPKLMAEDDLVTLYQAAENEDRLR